MTISTDGPLLQVIFTQLIDRVPPPDENARQSLILVHRRELVEQAAHHCERAYPDKSIEVEMGASHASGMADITIASIQSLVSADRIAKFDPNNFKLVLVDEAHHAVASSYLRTFEHFGLREQNQSQCALVGVSATMSRFDGLKLGAAIDHIVYHKDYLDMIEAKWLSNVIFTTVESKANLSKVKTGKDGDFLTSSLSRAVNTEKTNEITVKAWLSEAQGRHSTIVFCVDIAHVMSMTSAFRRLGIDARYITGETPTRVRAERLAEFKRRQFPVLINCGIFTEGTDMPNIDCVLLARPTRSRNLLIQMIGRGMRLFTGKQDCHVIDMVGAHRTGIVTVPTLFGLDPSEIVHRVNSSEMKELGQNPMNQSEHLRPISRANPELREDISLTMTRYDSVMELVDDSSSESHIRALSLNAWVQADEDRYILSAPSGTISIRALGTDEPKHSAEPSPAFDISYVRALPESAKVPFAKARSIGTALSLADAIRAADTFAAGVMERIFILRRAEWRKRPASEGQLKLLNKAFSNDGEPLTAADVTKGKAADMLTKLKYGAKKRFSRAMIEKRKSERTQAKLDDLKRRETVQVGPVET